MKVKPQATILRDIGKSNNPANLASVEAKKVGLSFWEYMESKRPGIVQKFSWGEKKLTRKQKREADGVVMQAMARSTNPRMRFLSQMRNLLGGRSY